MDERKKKIRYRVDCWIPIEAEDPELYDNFSNAEIALRECRSMQPENIYGITEVISFPED